MNRGQQPKEPSLLEMELRQIGKFMSVDLNANTCQWFALCTRPATTSRPGHLFTGVGQAEVFDIPVCDQCAEFVDYLEAENA